MPEGDGQVLPPPSGSDANEGGEWSDAVVASLDRASSASRLVGRATCTVSNPGTLVDTTGVK